MKKPWPAWKVTLLTALAALVLVVAMAGMSDTKDPEKAGEEAGRKFAFLVLGAPLVAYIVQKVRLDSWNAKHSGPPS